MLELSNLAMQFAKDNLHLRDVVVDLDSADKRGTFFGTLSLSNKDDFGMMLIKEGLAQVNVMGGRAPFNIEQLEDAEEQAKYDGVGIWDKSMKLMTQASPKKVKQNVKI